VLKNGDILQWSPSNNIKRRKAASEQFIALASGTQLNSLPKTPSLIDPVEKYVLKLQDFF